MRNLQVRKMDKVVHIDSVGDRYFLCKKHTITYHGYCKKCNPMLHSIVRVISFLMAATIIIGFLISVGRLLMAMI